MCLYVVMIRIARRDESNHRSLLALYGRDYDSGGEEDETQKRRENIRETRRNINGTV